jgi:hypothetical protein
MTFSNVRAVREICVTFFELPVFLIVFPWTMFEVLLLSLQRGKKNQVID